MQCLLIFLIFGAILGDGALFEQTCNNCLSQN